MGVQKAKLFVKLRIRIWTHVSKFQGKCLINHPTPGINHPVSLTTWWKCMKAQQVEIWVGTIHSPKDCWQMSHGICHHILSAPWGHQSIRRPKWQVVQRSRLITNSPSFPFVSFVLSSWYLSANCRYYI